MSDYATADVTIMTMVAISMTPAQVHPSQRSRLPFRCSPMTSFLLVSSTTRMRRGDARAPFTKAARKSILTALNLFPASMQLCISIATRRTGKTSWESPAEFAKPA